MDVSVHSRQHNRNTLEELWYRADFRISTDGLVRIHGTVTETEDFFSVVGDSLYDAVERAHEQIDSLTYDYHLIREVVAMYRLTREGLTLDAILDLVDNEVIDATRLALRHRELVTQDESDLGSYDQYTDRRLEGYPDDDLDLAGDGLTHALLYPGRLNRA